MVEGGRRVSRCSQIRFRKLLTEISSPQTIPARSMAEEDEAISIDRHEEFMRFALAQAQLALDSGEVPVGCVFVDPNNHHNIVSTGHNQVRGVADRKISKIYCIPSCLTVH